MCRGTRAPRQPLRVTSAVAPGRKTSQPLPFTGDRVELSDRPAAGIADGSVRVTTGSVEAVSLAPCRLPSVLLVLSHV